MNEKNYYGETYAVPASAPMAVQGAYAQGQPMQAQGAYSQGQTIYVSTVHQPQSTDYRSPQLVVNSAVRPSRPMGQWSDSICDWPRNLFPSCWCAVCCCWGIYIQAQSKLGSSASFSSSLSPSRPISLFLAVFTIDAG